MPARRNNRTTRVPVEDNNDAQFPQDFVDTAPDAVSHEAVDDSIYESAPYEQSVNNLNLTTGSDSEPVATNSNSHSRSSDDSDDLPPTLNVVTTVDATITAVDAAPHPPPSHSTILAQMDPIMVNVLAILREERNELLKEMEKKRQEDKAEADERYRKYKAETEERHRKDKTETEEKYLKRKAEGSQKLVKSTTEQNDRLNDKVKKLPVFSPKNHQPFFRQLQYALEEIDVSQRPIFCQKIVDSDKVPINDLGLPENFSFDDIGAILTRFRACLNVDQKISDNNLGTQISHILNPSKKVHDMVHTVRNVNILISQISDTELKQGFRSHTFMLYKNYAKAQSFTSHPTHTLITGLLKDPATTYDSFVQEVMCMSTVLTPAERSKLYGKGKHNLFDKPESSETATTDSITSNKREYDSKEGSKHTKRPRFYGKGNDNKSKGEHDGSTVAATTTSNTKLNDKVRNLPVFSHKDPRSEMYSFHK